MARLRSSWIAGQLVARTLHPRHAWNWLRLATGHGPPETVRGNPQLQLYSEMIPGGALHYGYFDDPETLADSISFDGMRQAQDRYSERVVELVGGEPRAVLDAGCGMGDVLSRLSRAGHTAVGLTPDRFQLDRLASTLPDIPVLPCRFEDMPVDDYVERFDTLIHAESLQYMDPGRVFEVVGRILAPEGRWIVADYFRNGRNGPKGANRSGWLWDPFVEGIRGSGFRIIHEEDITRHVLPTLAFAHLLARRIGLAGFDFGVRKLEAKRPVLHYLLENVVSRGRGFLVDQLAVLDPGTFADSKRYMLIAMERG